jgi:SpoVK/Ycf46/Vps4 family AAA+-type ATPase
MSPIAVIVDEADAQLGNRASSGDSGVSSRVFAQIAQFMGNTELRGKVIWFLLTCRPDLLPVDLKRQGRAEEHIALFYPHTDEDRLAMLHAVLKKTGTTLASAEAEAVFLKHADGLSGADVEAILTRARMNQPGRSQIRAGGFHSAILPHRNRNAKPGSRAGMHQPQLAARQIQGYGSRGSNPPLAHALACRGELQFAVQTNPQITMPSIRKTRFVGTNRGTVFTSMSGVPSRQKLWKSRFSPVR